MEPKKILIIGCNGFIGSHAFSHLSKNNKYVFGADIQQFNSQTFLLKSDLSNINLVFQQQVYDVCINASGSATVGFSLHNEAADYQLNYKNVEKILEAIHRFQPSCRFVNLSSAAVYGNPSELPIKETTPTKPISPYGKHKLLSEKLLHDYTLKYNLPTLSLRIFSVYGIGLKKQIFWDIFQRSKNSEHIELYGKGTETRDFIYIDDLMLALEKIILFAKFDGSELNVACGKEITISEAASLFAHYVNPAIQISFSGIQNVLDPLNWKADITKLNKIGFEPQMSIEQGLKKYALWLKELS
jgi:dTDP-glucose 4,6-dehydratase/UDP-glucose 4-epimerase